jgi:hypothetical protein
LRRDHALRRDVFFEPADDQVARLGRDENLPARKHRVAVAAFDEKNVTPEIAAKHPEAGDIWLWTTLDADSKLMVSWRLGERDLATAYDSTHDLAEPRAAHDRWL